VIILKDGTAAADPRLGRLPGWDERNEQYPLRAILSRRPPRRKTWTIRKAARLDQGDGPTCVGHAWTHRANALPKSHSFDHDFALRWYDIATDLDNIPGKGDGSTTLGGAKAGVKLGLINVFRWANTSSLDDIIETIGYEGPVVVGTNWYRRMFTPDEKGRITVNGPIDGGHEYLLRGVNPAAEEFLITNSWTLSWGLSGDAKISFPDMLRLLNEDGDACAPTER
jgi:hypothetical protein